LSDDANLESRTAQALRHYREALAKVETGTRGSLATVVRSDEACYALIEAAATLGVARQALTALEQQLGYIPDVPTAGADSKDIGHSLI